MVDIWKMQEEGTYLDVMGSGDSTCGEESAKLVLQEKGLKYCFLAFGRKKNLAITSY
jgi:hypothetical protein